MLFIVQTALQLGVMYALVSMALFLSYRILDIADLTTDGTFVLGLAVSVSLAAAGHPILAFPAAMAAGACAGFVTAFLQTRLGVPSILAGIITNTGLYTINLMAMGWSSNVSLLRQETAFTLFRTTGIGGDWYELVLAGIITVLAGVALVWFLGTKTGLSIRATGDNRDMVRASSINPTFTITLGLCIANALTALSGSCGRADAENGGYQRGNRYRRYRSGLSDYRGDRSWPRRHLARRNCSDCGKHNLSVYLCHRASNRHRSN